MIEGFDRKRLEELEQSTEFAIGLDLSVDLTFQSMDDFSPAAIARKLEPLAKLLESRQQLSNLLTYMDGKSGAEDLIARVLKDPALLQSLASAPKPESTTEEAAQ